LFYGGKFAVTEERNGQVQLAKTSSTWYRIVDVYVNWSCYPDI